MRIIYYYILLFFLFSASEKPYFNLFKLKEDIIAKIEQGEIVTIKTKKRYGDGEHYQVYGIVNSNINDVFEAVHNFNDYPNFMPRFDSVQTVENSDTLYAYIFNITLPLNIKYKYKIKSEKYHQESSAWLAWKTVPWEHNSIVETWGQWYLTSYNNSTNQTLIEYQVYTDPGYIPFGFGWIADIMTEKTLPETIESLKYWVEKNEK